MAWGVCGLCFLAHPQFLNANAPGPLRVPSGLLHWVLICGASCFELIPLALAPPLLQTHYQFALHPLAVYCHVPMDTNYRCWPAAALPVIGWQKAVA